MGETAFGLNHDLAVKRWSTDLAVEAETRQYFSKFFGTDENAVIKVKNDLKKAAGDKITVGLEMKLSGAGIEGDDTIAGTSAEEALTHFADSVFIDQLRKGTKSKGKMSEQRVPYNLRKQGRNALAVWWAEEYDQEVMMYLAGARGIDTSYHAPLNWTGRAENSFNAPDSAHIIYSDTSGTPAASKADLAASDKMTLNTIARCIARQETISPGIRPIQYEGEQKNILLMHIFQAHDLRASTSDGDWLDIHKSTDGAKSPIYKNALGEYNGVILHKHRNVVRFSDYGAGSDVAAGRALFLGAHAGIAAWGGSTPERRYSWHEETEDRGNKLVITAGAIFGIKKSRFNSKDIGVIAVDTACADPNA